MKIGILSDSHNDIDHLVAALKILDRESAAKRKYHGIEQHIQCSDVPKRAIKMGNILKRKTLGPVYGFGAR